MRARRLLAGRDAFREASLKASEMQLGLNSDNFMVEFGFETSSMGRHSFKALKISVIFAAP